jgi:hypothetical protein
MRVSRRRAAAGFPVRLVILAAGAGVFAGYSASSVVRSTSALPADGSPGVQASNTRAKTDNLASLIRTAVTVPEARRYAPAAAATTGADLDRFYDMVTAVAPMTPLAQPPETAPAAEPAGPQAAPAGAQIVTAPLPAAKPRALPPPPPAPAPMGLLDDAQIAGIKGRLRLTAEQAEYWPPVETALRAVAKVQLREMRVNRNPTGKVNIDVGSPEVQQLIWASMPLLRQLREDQKREVRRLVRVIGLEQVASQI